MATKKITVSDAFSYAWGAFGKNFLFLVSVVAFVFVVTMSLSYLADNSSGILGASLNLIYWIVSMLTGIGLTVITLKIYNKKKPQFLDIVNHAHLFISYLIGTIFYTIIITVGFVLLIVPGFIFMIRFQLFTYYIVDKNVGPIEALKKSWRATKGYGGDLFILWLLSTLISAIGLLMMGIGMLVAAPVVMLIQVYVYKKLSKGVK